MSQLPIANTDVVREHARRLVRQHRASLARTLIFYGLAAVAALVPAWIIGLITNLATNHQLSGPRIDRDVAGLVASSLAYAGLTYVARRRSYVLGETVFAQLREEFVASVLALPLVAVERASTGDLLSRTTNDIESLSRTVRFAAPEWTVAIMQAGLTLAAMLLVSPEAAAASLVSLPIVFLSTRRYLRFATPGYRRERISYATISGTVSETTEGARTVDALRIGERQHRRIDDNIRESFYAELYTLLMRVTWFPTVETAFALAVAATLGWSGWLALHHVITLGAATTVTLYVVQINNPIDTMISWLDELQIGQTALARLVGVAEIHDDRSRTHRTPINEVITLDHVDYAYRDDRDVLHDISLVIQPGERLAIVGPSGAGKSTIGRLIAGFDAPRRGSARIGDVELASLAINDLRSHVALVTQEHHVFIGTLRDNLALARPTATDDDLLNALDAVDALAWATALPAGLDTELGTVGFQLAPSEAQRVALARLILANPHTLVLDEATALLDPRAARHLERSLSAVLTGRTVVAIAHRLHTAHDADRICVVADGRIVELGHHEDLVARDGTYAALWRSWHGDGRSDS